MGNFKYRLKEAEKPKVGDVEISNGTKYTVKSIDPETGAIEWSIEKVADFTKIYKDLESAKEDLDSLKVMDQVKGDAKIREVADLVTKAFNEYRTNLRKNYPDAFATVKRVSEESTVGGGAGQAGFTSGTEGENYATKYAFRKKVKEDKGITPGPGPKAGPEGVTKNKYVTDYKYKLVNKKELNKAAKGIDVKPLWEADFNTDEFVKTLNITNPTLLDWVKKRIEAFSTLERQLNQLIPLLQQAKKDTIKKYSQNPNFAVIYGTDLAQEYLNDIIELFKNPE